MRRIDEFRKHRSEYPELYRIETTYQPTGLDTSDRKIYHRLYGRLRLERSRRATLKGLYGLTLEAYSQLYESQRGMCAICGKGIVRAYDGTGKRGPRAHGAYVDHDHACCPGRKSCGRCVRGLLCRQCNQGLGSFRDSAKLLLVAARYVAGKD